MSEHETDAPARFIVLWAPDWPVVAHAAESRIPIAAPLAVIDRGEVFACSAAARAEGVRRGLRLREAQARCPALQVVTYDPALDARSFEPVLSGLEQLLPGLHPLRPGAVALAARGPARYYGGEQAAALTVAAAAIELGAVDARAGVADGLFAAALAARSGQKVRVVPPGGARSFLAPLPVRLLEHPELVALLPRLGIRTLGEFADLDPEHVLERFGPQGAQLHALAAGRDSRSAAPRVPPRDVDVDVHFEPPLERVDQVAFGVRTASDDFLAGLLEQRLVCTAVRVQLIGEEGEMSERVWLHPRSFSASEVVDRIRWQLQAATVDSGGRSGGGELRSPVARVRIQPETVDPVGVHERGLWGTGPDEGVHSGLSRVQGMVGHRGVLTAAPSGGRRPSERQAFIPWGDRPLVARDPERPWPGALPAPAPATVYELPRQLSVHDAQGASVAVDDRGALSAPPRVMISATGARRDLTSWAGPWPLEERWWDPSASRRAHRFQVVDAHGSAWLLVLDEVGWWAEGCYD